MKGILMRLAGVLAVAAAMALPGMGGAEGEMLINGKLQNGSFEEGQSWTDKSYNQPDQANVPAWNTTAVDEKIELFRTNTGVYITGVTLSPSEGNYAAELNADEESTLYQKLSTEPSSLYEWGLDHGSRTELDTMALIIGPTQDIDPSKNIGRGLSGGVWVESKKFGRDQFMQMVDWLKNEKLITAPFEEGIAHGGTPTIVYSKKFGLDGTFQNNADNKPFSLKPGTEYTETWYVWVMSDSNSKSGTNKWSSYGSNAETSKNQNQRLDLSKYYLYPVPAGQLETTFAFVSVESQLGNKTYGNFLDNLNFKLYRSLSGSTTPHGSAIIGDSNGGISAEGGASSGHHVTADNGVSVYVEDGQSLTIQAKISEGDKPNVKFAGVYFTVPSESGSRTVFIVNPSEGSSAWVKTTVDGNDIYTYTLGTVSSAINLHFVFIKNPLITYDVNGGDPYKCTPQGSNTSEDPDHVYSFKPDNTSQEGIRYIEPYTSHAAVKQGDDQWKFVGWQLFDDTGAVALLPGEHKVACNYKSGGSHAGTKQRFIVIDTGDFIRDSQEEYDASWSTTAGMRYNADATGLTFVAQWRWKQTFIPMVREDSLIYSPSAAGGTVTLTGKEDPDDDNYKANENGKGSKAYFSDVDEKITAKADAYDGYGFDGWYDATGNLVSLSDELTYEVKKGKTNIYHARFSRLYPQTFVRQIWNGSSWQLLDAKSTTVPVLSQSTGLVGYGQYTSSTASNNQDYGVVGWYADEAGNVPVSPALISNNGKTIGYSVTGEATYYVRYKPAVTIQFKTCLDNSINTKGGSVSVSAVNAVPGEQVSCTIFENVGYRFLGWYDGIGSDAQKVADADQGSLTVAAPDSSKTYYAWFTARTDTPYKVYHYFRNFDGDGKDVLKDQFTYYGTTGEQVTPEITPKLSESDRAGYVLETPITSGTISGNGGLIFKLYYTRTPQTLTYWKNPPNNAAAEDKSTTQNGYVGCNAAVIINPYSISGYEFVGWNTAANGTGEMYHPESSYLMQKTGDNGENPNNLYAIWVAKDNSAQYSVKHIRHSLTGDLEDTEELYGTKGSTVTAIARTYDGYLLRADQNEMSGEIPENGILVLSVHYDPKPATLVYKANGGSGADHTVSDRNMVIGRQIAVGENIFSRAGYTFAGWKTPTGERVYKAGDLFTLTGEENILLAQWTANKNTPYKVYHYMVTADGFGCSIGSYEDKTGQTGTTATASERTFAGYSYKKDYNSNGMVEKKSGVIDGNGGLILKLYYVPNPVKLTYDANDGSGRTYVSNGHAGESTFVATNPFSRPGYDFRIWNQEASPAGSEGIVPGTLYSYGTQDSHLYAQWTPKSTTLTYKSNYPGGAEDKVTRGLFVDQTVPLAGDVFSRKGYELIGWMTEANGGTTYPVNEGYTLLANDDKNVNPNVLYAKWSAKSTTLTYRSNYPGGAEDKVTKGLLVDQTVPLAGDVFSRKGYELIGWMTEANGGTTYPVNEGYTLLANDDNNVNPNVLYAKWSAKSTTLTYRSNYPGGAEDKVTKGLLVDQTVPLAGDVFSREGYELVGWTTTETGGVSYQIGDGYTLLPDDNNDVNPNVLYAKWQPSAKTKYTIDHYLLNSSRTKRTFLRSVEAEGTTGTAVNYAKYELHLDGYSLYTDYPGTVLEGAILADGSLKLVLHYAPNPITLTYKANGGVGSDVVRNAFVDDQVEVIVNPYSYENHTFIGWNTQPDGSGTGYQPVDPYRMEAGITHVLYAQWQEDSKTTLTYDANGGTGIMAVREGYVGTQVPVDDNQFSRLGYTFTGWNTRPEGSGTAYAAGSAYTLTAGTDILYAQWSPVLPVVLPEDADLPQTGDESHLTLWLLLLAGSTAVTALALRGKGRRRVRK